MTSPPAVFNATRISATNKASSAMNYDHQLVVTVQHGLLPELRVREQELGQDLLSEFAHSFSLHLTIDVTDRYQLLPPANPTAQAHWVADPDAIKALGELVRQERNTLAGLAPIVPTSTARPAVRQPADPRLAQWKARLRPTRSPGAPHRPSAAPPGCPTCCGRFSSPPSPRGG